MPEAQEEPPWSPGGGASVSRGAVETAVQKTFGPSGFFTFCPRPFAYIYSTSVCDERMCDVMDTLRVDALQREPWAEGVGPQRTRG